jgi:hypothetical protein
LLAALAQHQLLSARPEVYFVAALPAATANLQCPEPPPACLPFLQLLQRELAAAKGILGVKLCQIQQEVQYSLQLAMMRGRQTSIYRSLTLFVMPAVFCLTEAGRGLAPKLPGMLQNLPNLLMDWMNLGFLEGVQHCRHCCGACVGVLTGH